MCFSWGILAVVQILDTDLCEEIGLILDLENTITRKLYGIGGTEICIEQKSDGYKVDNKPIMVTYIGDMISNPYCEICVPVKP